jgi:methylglutaconyl-CoA hydratase
MGGGAGLTAASDVAVAHENAIFGFTEVKFGLAPATIGPHVVEKIGAGAALPLFLTGELLSATQARMIGLVHRVAEEGQLDHMVGEIVDALLAGSPNGQAAAKQLVRKITWTPRDEIDEHTSQLIASLRASPEGREGVAAFLEKRKPKWAPE